jgi:hypothetical protein
MNEPLFCEIEVIMPIHAVDLVKLCDAIRKAVGIAIWRKSVWIVAENILQIPITNPYQAISLKAQIFDNGYWKAFVRNVGIRETVQ